MKKNNKDDIIGLSVIIFIVLVFVVFAYSSISRGNKYTEHEYSLLELNDGVYGIYTNVSSRVPAENYEMITVCVNTQVHTFKGHVYIYYTNDNPHMIYKDYHYVNSDKMYVYVPYGSIKYQENVGI